MTILFTFLTALALQAPQVNIETLDGTKHTGELQAMSVQNVQVKTPQGTETVPTERLMKVDFDREKQKISMAGKVLVTLVDGSHMLTQGFQVNKESATLVSTIGPGGVKVPISDIYSVRFINRTGTLDDQWERICEAPTDSDRLIVAKEDALDYLVGSLGEITNVRVVFTLDGEPLKVKREKVFGITYYHPTGRTIPKSLGRLITTDGSSWAFTEIVMDAGNFNLVTTLGLEVSFPVDTVAAFDFAEGKVAYLSDMKPSSVTWTPYLSLMGTTGGNDNHGRATFFGPKFDRSFQAGPLTLDGKTYDKGLALHSRSVIVYRLGKKYGRLTATAGIADRVRPQGHVQLKIEADGKVLLDTEISGKQMAIPIDLDLAQAEKLTITVDYGQKTDIADRLILGDAKVME
ncbi:MAG: NPCBM/NEW2 domain-containing protein [Planctomycetia bacterium]|jgi:hypothetical protein